MNRMNRHLYVLIVAVVFSCAKKTEKEDDEKKSGIGDSIYKNIDQMGADGEFINESDTINVGGYALIFSPADSTHLTDVFGDSPIRKDLVDSIGNSHERAMFLEKNYLSKKFSKYFSANDSILTLYLDSGNELHFPKWDRTDEVGYNFQNYFKEIDYYSLWVQYVEGGSIVLVNRKSGTKKYVIGEPYISPEAKRIVAINIDLWAGFSANGIELLSVMGDSLKTEFSLEIENWGPSGARWLSDDKLILEKEYRDPKIGKRFSLLQIVQQ